MQAIIPADVKACVFRGRQGLNPLPLVSRRPSHPRGGSRDYVSCLLVMELGHKACAVYMGFNEAPKWGRLGAGAMELH